MEKSFKVGDRIFWQDAVHPSFGSYGVVASVGEGNIFVVWDGDKENEISTIPVPAAECRIVPFFPGDPVRLIKFHPMKGIVKSVTESACIVSWNNGQVNEMENIMLELDPPEDQIADPA